MPYHPLPTGLRPVFAALVLCAAAGAVPGALRAETGAPATPPADQQPVEWSQDPANPAHAQFARMMAPTIAEADRVIGPGHHVQAALVDVNRDGQAEIIGRALGRYFCGSEGCPTTLYAFQDGQWRIVLDVLTHDVALSGSSTEGWRDLILNGVVRWQYDGQSYTISGG